jgi:WD40 repeat protein
MPLKPLAADDIFISYSRRDASTYAAGLADELTRRGFSCFIDRLGTDPDADLPDMLKRKIKSCAMLVVVCTEWAGTRQTIEEEIGEFLRTGRRTSVVPVDFGDAVYSARWYRLVEGIAPEPEKNPRALDDGNPSPSVVSRIEKQFNYTRRNQRLRRVTYATAAVLVALLLASAVAGVYAAQQIKVAKAASAAAENARTEAAGERSKADDARREAEAAQTEANKARDEAAEQRRLAGIAAEDAKQKGLLAAEKTRLADEAARRAKAAEASRVVAQAAAERQQAIAEVRSIANQSQELLRQRPDEARRSLSLAVDSMKKAVALGIRSVEADAALRDSLAVLPRLRRAHTYTGIYSAALSPDGRHLAMFTLDKLRVYESGGETPLKEMACINGGALALSSGVAYAAMLEGAAHRIRILDLKDDARSHTLDLGEERANEIALSPGGRYVAYSFSAGLDRNKVRVLEAASGKQVALLDKFDMFINDIAFGPSGNLAAGGRAGAIGSFGRVVIWSLPLNYADGKPEPDLTESSFSDFVVITEGEEVRAVAPGTDSTYFARDGTVWKRFPGQAGYELITYLPIAKREPGHIYDVAFGPDGRSLSLMRNLSYWIDSRSTSEYEVWDAAGYRAAGWETYGGEEGIIDLAFKPGSGGQLIATSGYDKDPSGNPEKLIRHVFRGGSEVPDDAFKPGKDDDQILEVFQRADYLFTTREGALMVWDVWGKKTTQIPLDPVRTMEAATVSPGGKFLAFSTTTEQDERPEVIVYRSEGDSYGEWKRLRPPGRFMVGFLSADGRLLAGIDVKEREHYRVRVWDVSSGRDVTPEAVRKLPKLTGGFSIGGLTGLSLSPGGRYLLVGHEVAGALLFDLSNGRNVSLPFHSTLASAAFSPDERYLALGSEEGLAYVFETARPGDEIARLQHTGSVTAVAISDDNKYVATASHLSVTDSLHVWLLQPADLLAQAAAR